MKDIQENMLIRKQIEADVEAFLAAGKQIKSIPDGHSGEVKIQLQDNGKSRNITVSPKKRKFA